MYSMPVLGQVDISEKERHGRLAAICDEFTTIAATYAFRIADMLQELKKRS